MSKRTPWLVASVFICLAACSAGRAPPTPVPAVTPGISEIDYWTSPIYEPEQRFEGVYSVGYETSALLGCWLEMTPQAHADRVRMTRDIPVEDWAERPWVEYQIEIIGRRTIRVPEHLPQPGYGHLSMYPCQIIATAVLRARELPQRLRAD